MSPHRHLSQLHPFFAVWGCTLICSLGNSDNKRYEALESKLTNLLSQEACEVGFNQGETLELSTPLWAIRLCFQDVCFHLKININSKQIMQMERLKKPWRYDATCHKVTQNFHSRHFLAFAHRKTLFLDLFPTSLGHTGLHIHCSSSPKLPFSFYLFPRL